jgi:prepilin-type N-terminal cleavage/methylation domain-containing protein
MRRPTGFSLIELIIVIVVVAIAAVAIGSAFGYISRSVGLNSDLQSVTLIAQECADHIVGSARKPGNYGAVPAGGTACDAIVAPAGHNRTVNVVNVVGASGTICTGAGWACKSVAITVTRGSATATVNFMIVNY